MNSECSSRGPSNKPSKSADARARRVWGAAGHEGPGDSWPAGHHWGAKPGVCRHSGGQDQTGQWDSHIQKAARNWRGKVQSDWMNLDCLFYEVRIILILIKLLLFFWLMYFKREK